jgi:hypothetical protein
MSEEVFKDGQEPTFFYEFCAFLFSVFLTVNLTFLTVNLTKTACDSIYRGTLQTVETEYFKGIDTPSIGYGYEPVCF